MVSVIHATSFSGRVGAIADNGPRIAKRDRRMKGGLVGLGKAGIGVLNAGSLFLAFHFRQIMKCSIHKCQI